MKDEDSLPANRGHVVELPSWLGGYFFSAGG